MILALVLVSVALAGALIYITVLLGRVSGLRERVARAEDEERFAAMAAKSLAVNAEALRQQNTAGLAEVLRPMKEDIDAFRESIRQAYSNEARERFALGERVRELIVGNSVLTAETRRLTDALKGNTRVQGNWGEMVLANILDHAGFRRGYEYHVQESVTDDDGRRLRPDVVISYSEGRKIVIDSKVSIQAYLDMVEATDEAARQMAARAHVASVRAHVAELRSKSYQDAIPQEGRFEYVLMFIPNEGAFLAAMGLDSKLWEAAYDSHVIIISPAHLMSIVKLIEQMWRHDKQNRNAIAIADEAGRMLDKFRGFVEDMDRIDKAINTARGAWNDAYGKLIAGTGSLVSRAEKLQNLGAKARKPLPGRYSGEDAPE